MVANPMDGWMSLSDYAKHCGINKSAISRQLGKVIPEAAYRRSGQSVLINVAAADRARTERLNPLLRRVDVPQSAPTYAAPPPEVEEERGTDAPAPRSALDTTGFHAGRAAKEMWSAKEKQLDVQQKLGRLLDKRDVYDAALAIGSRLRQALDSRAQLLAADLAGMTDPAEIAAKLQAADDRVLIDLADEFEVAAGLRSADGRDAA